MAMLDVKDLTVSYGVIQALKGISFSVNEGEIIALIGANGAGKTTTLHTVTGLLPAKSGSIWFEGKDIPDLPEGELRQIRGEKIGMIFQDAGASLCPIRTIGEQIYESMCAHRKISKAEAKEKALELFEKLNFKDGERIWDSYSFELSGGMNQRVGIVLAMLMQPQILLADEPTGNLDETTADEIIALLKKTAHELGKCVVVVTHSKHLAEEADEILEIKNGAISFLSE